MLINSLLAGKLGNWPVYIDCLATLQEQSEAYSRAQHTMHSLRSGIIVIVTKHLFCTATRTA